VLVDTSDLGESLSFQLPIAGKSYLALAASDFVPFFEIPADLADPLASAKADLRETLLRLEVAPDSGDCRQPNSTTCKKAVLNEVWIRIA
jgi:hypothetical protein